MKKIVVNGVLYEAVNVNELYKNLQQAIDFLQQAKHSVSDKNQKRAIKACQTKIKKTYFKIQDIEKNRYGAKFNPLTDEERLKNLHSIDANLEKKYEQAPNKRNS